MFVLCVTIHRHSIYVMMETACLYCVLLLHRHSIYVMMETACLYLCYSA